MSVRHGADPMNAVLLHEAHMCQLMIPTVAPMVGCTGSRHARVFRRCVRACRYIAAHAECAQNERQTDVTLADVLLGKAIAG